MSSTQNILKKLSMAICMFSLCLGTLPLSASPNVHSQASSLAMGQFLVANNELDARTLTFVNTEMARKDEGAHWHTTHTAALHRVHKLRVNSNIDTDPISYVPANCHY